MAALSSSANAAASESSAPHLWKVLKATVSILIHVSQWLFSVDHPIRKTPPGCPGGVFMF
jgi:hypothetical protein